ncbi:KGGVGR-motif variant AAA ATPase [Goodfellowiella coeruleoviolacea]|uniref:CobQ/CobB/MinD/ParA nucleotide binding domain-containing protein n=1 Tax=Goodfellowiella coeruleoviolacea TaxID=334858 RepID=A0AAE3KJP9_9PSEU|nr:P-loop NTPase [Goodfellowiella coeruleoviolacea]MCP2164558.1 CobQ/CobB/MinD/ParA nucleotide binding domain-containing protein [Goodfellowiella coeruleoviolacea]
MTVHFDRAWSQGCGLARETAEQGFDVVLVRDMLGRLSLVVDAPDATQLPSDLADRLRGAAGAFAGAVHTADDLFDVDLVLKSPDRVALWQNPDGPGRLWTLERGVVGADWTRPDRLDEAVERRVTLYGFKGGVGRSTATAMLAQHLAATGRCVLVVDLDLESPGVGALLRETEQLPLYGIVDHLVEAAVGNADSLDLVTRVQVPHVRGNGEVWLAPASGKPRPEYDYLAKLNRVYTDLPGQRFGDRLRAAINACENQVERLSRKPDVVLLDSRAGIHDIAAVAITQLSGLSLLFAVDNPQTWAGYRSLFAQWLRSGTAPDIRKRLQMVAALVPASDKNYLSNFIDHAQECFADTLYDDVGGGDTGAFNFAPDDQDGPHWPLPILFHGDLVGLNPVARPNWYAEPLIFAAYEKFLELAAQLVVGEEL